MVEQAKKLGIEKCVNFRGLSKQVKEEIIDSVMFVLSSDYEGISNSMIEALADAMVKVAKILNSRHNYLKMERRYVKNMD